MFSDESCVSLREAVGLQHISELFTTTGGLI